MKTYYNDTMKDKMFTTKRLVLMCGVPGSGKSTLAKFLATRMNVLFTDTVYISRDDIRFSIVAEDEPYFLRENEVFDEFVRRIKNNLDRNVTVFADATHLNRGSRTKLLRALGDSLKNTAVEVCVLDVPLDYAIDNNEKRKGTRAYVPIKTIKNMCENFKIPEFNEGFDAINIYYVNDLNMATWKAAMIDEVMKKDE